MELRPGLKLHSAVCDTQVIVVRAPTTAVVLGCGGARLLTDADAGAATTGAALHTELAGGTLLGKRYADEEIGLEVLCTRAGAGTLTCDGVALAVKGAKPLPSSD